jgi:hypothetical protein
MLLCARAVHLWGKRALMRRLHDNQNEAQGYAKAFPDRIFTARLQGAAFVSPDIS